MKAVTYPLSLFRLQNRELRFSIGIATALVAGVIAAPYFAFDHARFVSSDGFLGYAATLTAALTGFFVTALVAAATFDRPALDSTMDRGPVFLDGEKITRRQFVTTIFGYLSLSALSFFLCAAIAITIAIPLSIEIKKAANISSDTYWWLSKAPVVLFSVWMAHIVSVTSIGLYYLMDRLYRREVAVLPTSTRSPSAPQGSTLR